MRASIPPCVPALGLGLVVSIVATAAGNLPWLALGAFSFVSGAIDGLRLAGICFRHLVVEALECLLLAALILVMCVFKPFASDAPHELD